MSSLQKITKLQLVELRDLYRAEWPLHVATFSAIVHFMERFEKHPEWEEKVKFWTLNDEWKQSGTFAMVNENDNHILFNTLEPWPYSSLQRTLELLDYDEPKVFISFRDIFRQIVHNVIRVQNLEICFDSSTRCKYTDRSFLDQFDDDMLADITKPPDGFHYNSLSLSHVDQIDAVWAQRHSRSKKFISTIITHNPTTGLFNTKTGELVAWCLMLETGAIGNLQVDEKYHRQGIGGLVALVQIAKVGKTLGREIVGHFAHQNEKSIKLADKNGNQWIDNYSWIGVKRRELPKLVPLWGHL